MQLYQLNWATAHNSFRLPELQSIAQLNNFPYALPPFSPELIASVNGEGCGLDEPWDENRPCLVLALERDEDAFALGQRVIGLRTITRIYVMTKSLELLNSHLRALPRTPDSRPWEKALVRSTAPGEGSSSSDGDWKRWKFRYESWGTSVSLPKQRENLAELSHLKLPGKIDLKNAEVEFGIFEEYETGLPGFTRPSADSPAAPPRMIYFTLLISASSARALVSHFSLKTRAHIGNTSMDAEVSLLMANQALAKSGSAVWDPFAGTGSMLVTCAHWGARVWGSDIDGRQMKGRDAIKGGTGPPGIHLSAAQYGVLDCIVDLLIFDVTKNPWRIGGMFDAIVTDPPYGVRAGAKRTGRKDPSRLKTEPYIFPPDHPNAGVASSSLPTYLPPFRPYEVAHLALDLARLARFALKPGGRLVFFLPVVNDEYEEVDIPVVEGMKLVANSIEDFGKWARRLITLELDLDARPVGPPAFDSERFGATPPAPLKGGSSEAELVASMDKASLEGEKARPFGTAALDFRQKYFSGFKASKKPEEST